MFSEFLHFLHLRIKNIENISFTIADVKVSLGMAYNSGCIFDVNETYHSYII